MQPVPVRCVRTGGFRVLSLLLILRCPVRTFFFELWEGLRIAFRAIATHKMRAVLTTLGIIIGIVSVTAMATVVNGIEKDFDEDMATLGTDVLYIERWPWVGSPGMKWWEYINRPTITADLADVIAERSRYAVATVPVASTRRVVTYQGNSVFDVEVLGVRATYPQVHPVDLAAGYFFSDFDDRSARTVCIIGAEIADRLIPIGDPLGKTIRIDGHRYQVVGVMERKGSGAEGPGSVDHQVIIPFNAFRNHFGMTRRDVSVRVKVGDPALIDLAKDELTGILRVARRLDAREENDFEINDQQALRAQIAPVKTAIYGIGLGLTALALLVGGIGVMNIMFVSVKERTREIGIRKAVGARRRTILLQFLIEAVIVSLVGGLLGVLLSLPLTLLIRLALPATLDLGVVAIAFGICALVGTVFGLAPAWTAARANPIEALRYE
ncbi:MAG: ABC transporter ATP-binding protein [Rhodothermaceae bacterium]|nr:MAG: ABC transporter ATP-binding protein [Rhodothermaceae bacterium]